VNMAECPLLPDDQQFLNCSYQWMRVTDNSTIGLIIQGYGLPEGYTPGKVDLMLLIPPNYPMGQIDMFYFSPDVTRKDGAAIGAINSEIHFGRQWQRWSRHYEWRPGIDSVSTHVTYIKNQLEFELDNRQQ